VATISRQREEINERWHAGITGRKALQLPTLRMYQASISSTTVHFCRVLRDNEVGGPDRELADLAYSYEVIASRIKRLVALCGGLVVPSETAFLATVTHRNLPMHGNQREALDSHLVRTL
jgi:hypothetical protein